MAVVVTATIPADEFALSEALRRRPATEFEAVRRVTDGTDLAMLWATARDVEDLPAVVAADPVVRTVDVLTTFEDEYLLRVEWTDRVRTGWDALVVDRGSIFEASASDGTWTLRILFEEHDAIAVTQAACEDADLPVTFERIFDLSGALWRDRYGLTASQHESIVAAYERGYYEVPREATLADLAAELGVSHQALSERLRRGHATLVQRALDPQLTGAPSR